MGSSAGLQSQTGHCGPSARPAPILNWLIKSKDSLVSWFAATGLHVRRYDLGALNI